MNKQDKAAEIASLEESFKSANAIFFADYKGLTVEQITVLRKQLRSAGKTKVKVVKNNLARIAVKKAGLGEPVEKLLDTVVGPTMVTFSYGDPAAVAKALHRFASEVQVFALKDSILEEQPVSVSDIEALSKLPSREVLLSKLLATFNAPVTNFVGVLAAVPRSAVQVLSAIEKKKSA